MSKVTQNLIKLESKEVRYFLPHKQNELKVIWLQNLIWLFWTVNKTFVFACASLATYFFEKYCIET